MRNRIILASLLTSLAALAPRAAGQSTFPFQLRVQQGATVLPILNNASVTLNADAVGQDITVTLAAIYRGTTQVTVAQPELVGAPELAVSGGSGFPVVLTPNAQFEVTFRYRSTTSSRVVAQASMSYVETAPPPPPGGTAGTGSSGQISLTLIGLAPELSLAYALADANTIPLPPGGRLVFPLTPVNTFSTATVIILNRGSGAGLVDAVSLTGSASLQLLGLALLPANVDAGRDLRFSIRYSPTQIETATATLQVTIGGRVSAFTLEASATGVSFAYELLDDTTVIPIVPNQSVPLSDTRVGARTSLAVRVRNIGNGVGSITSITTFGAGFQLVDLPPLPQTLAPGAALVIGLAFAPTQPGAVIGRLRIGNDSFDFAAVGIGPRLTFGYTVADTLVAIVAGGTVPFSPTQVGQRAIRDFIIRNTGNAPATIASIDLAGVGVSNFSFGSVPNLPLVLAPEGAATVQVVYTPNNLGAVTASLRIDELTFTLSGSSNSPPPLAGYRIEGASGVQEPLQQPAISVTLTQPYPLALRGSLVITISPDGFVIDPAVQFSSGSRTVDFTIPANSTRAVFAADATQVRFQTGSVAGTIVVTPVFNTQSGILLSANDGSPLRLTVAPAAPRLLSFAIAARTGTTFSLLVTGLATTRSLTQMNLQFTRASGGAAIPVTINLEAPAGAWYRGSDSVAVGSLFNATIPFTIQGGPTDGLTAISSISVTVANERGTSNSLSTEVR